MADNTPIEWTDATANFLNGCSVLTAGCKRCYAMKLAGTRMKDHPTRKGLTIDTKEGPVWTGEVRPHWPAIAQVLSWTKPRMIFWNAHGDLFHENVPDELIDCVFAAAALTPQHTHQFLTKRSARMMQYYRGLDLAGGVGRVARFAVAMGRIFQETGHHSCKPGQGVPIVPHPLPNVWLGVSAENQECWDERVSHLRQCSAAVRWVSAEPLLGEIVDSMHMHLIDWVVAGGESGPKSRPMHPGWAIALREQCAGTGTAFLFKQWGDWMPVTRLAYVGDDPGTARPIRSAIISGRIYRREHIHHFPDNQPMVRVGKKIAGRMLVGVQHDGYPVSS